MANLPRLLAPRPLLSAALLVLVCLSAEGLAAQYQFAAKYTSGPPPSPYLYTFYGEAPAINNAGELAFLMTRSGNREPTLQGLWRGNGGALLRIMPFSAISYMTFDLSESFLHHSHGSQEYAVTPQGTTRFPASRLRV